MCDAAPSGESLAVALPQRSARGRRRGRAAKSEPEPEPEPATLPEEEGEEEGEDVDEGRVRAATVATLADVSRDEVVPGVTH